MKSKGKSLRNGDTGQAGGLVPASRGHRRKRSKPVAYLFILPTIILFGIFVCWPLVQTVYLSFTNWEGIGAIQFIGLKNYKEFFQDDLVRMAIKNNLLWMVVMCTFPIAIGLVQASLLVNSGIRHGKIFQLILFLPQVFSSVIAAVIWSWMYNSAMGPLNEMLRAIGLESWALPWLGNPQTVMICLLVMAVWMAYGFNTVVFSAAIQGIDTDLYEAATMDGCGVMRRFWHITVPGVRSTMTTLLLFALIDSFKVFDIVYQMTKGGPGYSSYVMSYYLYDQAFIKNRTGYGATIAVIMTIFILVISRVFLRVRERGDRA